jgi:hypothetical protein
MERIVAAVDKGDLDVLYSSQVAFAPSSRVVRVGILLPELDRNWISPLFRHLVHDHDWLFDSSVHKLR